MAALDLFCYAQAFSSCSEWGLLSSCGAQASRSGFSSCGARALGCVGFSSCGAWPWLPLSTWNLPGPRIKPMDPALAGRFLTTGLPGKSPPFFLMTSQM